MKTPIRESSYNSVWCSVQSFVCNILHVNMSHAVNSRVSEYVSMHVYNDVEQCMYRVASRIVLEIKL